MLQILHISAECFPVAKVGGLADVVGALPKFQESLGQRAQVMMPFYDTKFTQSNTLSVHTNGTIYLGEQQYSYVILTTKKELLSFELFLVKIQGLTDRENVYGYVDDVARFTAFQKVVADFILEQKEKPTIIHCHDHHTALIPFFIGRCKKYDSLKNIPTVLTIHNAQYQGEFDYDRYNYIPEHLESDKGLLDWNRKINPLATGIKCAWKITTVSPTYLKELQHHANGLESLIRHEHKKSLGILNGVDLDVWNPETDPYLIANFNGRKTATGRALNKKSLCKDFELDPKLPLVAFIGRFVYEKGSDLLPELIKTVLQDKKQKVSLLVLGSGDPETEQQLQLLKPELKGTYNNYIGYNEQLAHIIYGGADFLLMPSRVEPCGLNQMYAMRYGMIPIVSAVGGLKDTVIDIEQDNQGYGIVCKEVSIESIGASIDRAVALYEDKVLFRAKRKQLFKIQNGWKHSAETYIQMYNSLIQHP